MHGEPAPLPRRVVLNFRGNRRTRADDGHIASEHVKELWELIDAELSDERANRSYTRIVLHFEYRAVHLIEMHQGLFFVFRIRTHGSEFIAGEIPSAPTDSNLPEDDRPT